jgi:hypothetical protein
MVPGSSFKTGSRTAKVGCPTSGLNWTRCWAAALETMAAETNNAFAMRM